MNEIVKGYKGFRDDLSCRGFKYEIGKEFIHNGRIEPCKSGFHFCRELKDVNDYYTLADENTRICEVEALGDVIDEENKTVTNKIKIVRELTKNEVFNLLNEGAGNTGIGNTGYRNTGDRNTGDWNTGYSNTGYSNTGDWNKTNRSSGVFCNEEPKMLMFNKPTDMTYEEWKNSEAFGILTNLVKNVWVCFDEMTEEEKEEHSSAKTCNGYLKEIPRAKSSEKWWKDLDISEKATIIQLPNFDLDIFNDIMELNITEKEYKEILKWLK